MAAVLDTSGAPAGSASQRTAPQLPMINRLLHAASAFAIQKLILPPIIVLSRVKNYIISPGGKYPDAIKAYPALKHLPVRIFYPPSYDRTSTNRLPVLLTIHGGGFVLGNPWDNDAWNRAFSTTHGYLVVALNYSKAPGSPFPKPVYDLEAVIQLVLADTTLPIDFDKIAMAGWSAGGNLTLAVSQLDTIKLHIKAVVPLYPVTDFVPTQRVKCEGRRYKPELGGFRGNTKDYLLSLSPLFNWAYLNPGTDYHDTLLSPSHAKREALPKNIFMIACELDMLAPEAWRMICSLAGKRVPRDDEVIGRQAINKEGELITVNDDRYAWEEVIKTDGGARYRWMLIPDQIHGFDQDSISHMVGNDEECLKDAKKKTEKMIEIIGEWLDQVMNVKK
ncbi:Alpha/Beta hydrolase protein [Apiosordaria backusii]|uniref:Alpha/Beta hydrolase protein n=1 Tax=Apiosordaria backusii TaxID=314023 RepID=A0AA40EMK6_9PEZI|nr:Alpha/Beta hydrolase protein [Apiosordaria backusii]